MTLQQHDGDITKVLDYFLAVALDHEDGTYIGFYGFTPETTYIRGAGSWIQATGVSLAKLNGAQLIEMKDSFILRFDSLEKKGLPVTEEVIKEKSTSGRPGSWDTQNK